MLSPTEYRGMDACELSAALRAKTLSCEDIVRCAIEQAETLNPLYNAIVTEDYASALQQARHIDANPELLAASPAAGLPFLIKDLAALNNLPWHRGSRLYRDSIAGHNSRIVQRYLDAGLVVLGKTNTPEHGLTLTTEPQAHGPCRNPWQPEYSTGGSSGGAAAAVAAGIVPIAHATDGGGSIRIPAACCGLVGLKPSRGLTPVNDQLSDCWSGMSVGHVVSQTVRDSALMLDITALHSPLLFPVPRIDKTYLEASAEPRAKLRIGLQLTHPMEETLHPDVIAGVERAGALCESLGHSVEVISHPVDYRPVVSAMSRLICLHTYQAVAPRLEELGQSIEESELEASTKFMATLGREIDADSYVNAIDALRQATLTMETFHRQMDVIVSPVLSLPPARLGWLDMNSEDQREYARRFRAYSGFTALYNGTGQPSMSLPLHSSEEGLPIGLMFTAAWGQDGMLLSLARSLEQTAPWPRTAPAPG